MTAHGYSTAAKLITLREDENAALVKPWRPTRRARVAEKSINTDSRVSPFSM